MSRLFSSAPEREILRRASGAPPIASVDAAEVARAAREHGVESVLTRGQEAHASRRDTAMELAHQVLLSEVARIGDGLAEAGIDAILLKGLSLAQRFYHPSWSRPCTDVDLLVEPHMLPRAEEALTRLGYSVEQGARGSFFRERHFHISFFAEGRLPIELHFLAYRGFGAELTARDLFTGSEPLSAVHPALRTPATAREIVFLAVHAAAHRFERIGWLLDLALIARACGDGPFAAAAEFAEARGFRRPFAAAMSLLREHFGLGAEFASHDTAVVRAASRAALAVAHAPSSRVASAATRLLYTLCLCDGPQARARFLTRTFIDKIVIPA